MLRAAGLALYLSDRRPFRALADQWSRQCQQWREQMPICDFAPVEQFLMPRRNTDRLTLNMRRNPALLKREGQLKQFNQSIQDLIQRKEPLPKDYHLTLILPDKSWQAQVERSVGSINRLIEPEGLVDSLKYWAFKKATQVKGKLHPVAMTVGERPHEMELSLNLSELHRDDLVKFASFVNSYPRK